MNRFYRLQLLAVIALVILGTASAYADIICVPTPLVLNESTTSGDVVITYTGGGLTNVAGYSLDIVWDNTVATAAFARPDNGPFNGAVTFYVVDLGLGHVRIDAAIGGADPGFTAGELCKVTFTAVTGVVDQTDVTLTIEALRDPLNQAVDGGVAVPGQVVVADNGAPVVTDVLVFNNTLGHTDDFLKDTDAITITANVTDSDPSFDGTNITADLSVFGGGVAVQPDSYVAPAATWTYVSIACIPADGTVIVTVTAIDASSNTADGSDTITSDNTAPSPLLGAGATPGYKQLHLSWLDFSGNDANPMGVQFRYAVWGDYPLYDAVEPAYPVDNLDGILAVEVASGTTADWPVLARDIYYVAGFVYDMVLHYSVAGIANQGRATNYWLGDVAGDDGDVGVDDISQLGATYGLLDGEGAWDPDCNVGPTDDSSRRGIPMPNADNEIAFEDMMIFALNYTVVTPSSKVLIGGTPVMTWSQVSEKTWALSLVSNGGDLQGLNLRAELPAGIDCTVAAGDLLADQSAPVFLRNIPRRGVDAGLALFGQGAGFSGSGELVRVTFSEPVAEIDVAVIARDENNKDLGVEMGTTSGAAVPTVASFAQNYPNPFNPSTTLTFELPQARQVHLAIYALDGSLVRTLVAGMREAGRHEVSWDGRNDAGRSVATGTYFAKVRAGDFNQIRKMVLLK
jgi:hypothetical protein